MSAEYAITVEQYAEEIRNWAQFDRDCREQRGKSHDPNVVFNFARVAATWQRLRWDIHTKGSSPGDSNRLDELGVALQGLATELGLGTVDRDKFLPGDPAVYLAGFGPRNTLRPWHTQCAYKPRKDT